MKEATVAEPAKPKSLEQLRREADEEKNKPAGTKMPSGVDHAPTNAETGEVRNEQQRLTQVGKELAKDIPPGQVTSDGTAKKFLPCADCGNAVYEDGPHVELGGSIRLYKKKDEHSNVTRVDASVGGDSQLTSEGGEPPPARHEAAYGDQTKDPAAPTVVNSGVWCSVMCLTRALTRLLK